MATRYGSDSISVAAPPENEKKSCSTNVIFCIVLNDRHFHFKMKPHTRLRKAFQGFTEAAAFQEGYYEVLTFTYHGVALNGSKTLRDYLIPENAVIEAGLASPRVLARRFNFESVAYEGLYKAYVDVGKAARELADISTVAYRSLLRTKIDIIKEAQAIAASAWQEHIEEASAQMNGHAS